MKTLPKKNDVLLAYKALNIMPGLGDAGRRVAGALIDHFHKKDGRCYPSVDRLCKLLGLNRATDFRATKTLHKRKIVSKVGDGGPYHQANYQPNWASLRGNVKDWDAKSLGENSCGAILEWITDAHQEAATGAELKIQRRRAAIHSCNHG